MKSIKLSNARVEKVDYVRGKNVKNPFILLTIAGYDTRMAMSVNVFLRTLKNSFMLDENVETINHPLTRSAMQQLMNGGVSGKATLMMKGEQYEVTAESRVITDENHPEYGQYEVGDTMEATRDNFRPEYGEFLTFTKSQEYMNAEAYANAQLSSLGAAMGFSNSATDNNDTDTTGKAAMGSDSDVEEEQAEEQGA